MELWEDELLLDDDFSDEEEDAEEQIEETGLEIDADGFADWEDSSDTAPVDETLEEALAEEHTLELESELEQDEHPRDYHAELEDEEEEAAPTSEKRLKREIRAEALKRLEEAARTESDFLTVVDEWNKLDRNRERRERDHENLRGDVPLEFQAVPDPKIAPLWMKLPATPCLKKFLRIRLDTASVSGLWRNAPQPSSWASPDCFMSPFPPRLRPAWKSAGVFCPNSRDSG